MNKFLEQERKEYKCLERLFNKYGDRTRIVYIEHEDD